MTIFILSWWDFLQEPDQSIIPLNIKRLAQLLLLNLQYFIGSCEECFILVHVYPLSHKLQGVQIISSSLKSCCYSWKHQFLDTVSPSCANVIDQKKTFIVRREGSGGQEPLLHIKLMIFFNFFQVNIDYHDNKSCL